MAFVPLEMSPLASFALINIGRPGKHNFRAFISNSY